MKKTFQLSFFLLLVLLLTVQPLCAQTPLVWQLATTIKTDSAIPHITYTYTTGSDELFIYTDRKIGNEYTADILYRTIDGGMSWNKNNVLEVLGATSFTPLTVIDPNTFFVHYVRTNIDTTVALYRTTDGGEHWTKLSQSEPTVSNLVMWNINEGMRLRSFTDTANTVRWLELTNDTGITWIRQPQDNPLFRMIAEGADDTTNYTYNIFTTRLTETKAITTVTPKQGATNHPTLYTTDAGNSWVSSNFDFPTPRISSGAIMHLLNSPYLAANITTGVAEVPFAFSTDYGMQWSQSTPFPGRLSHRIRPAGNTKFWTQKPGKANSLLYTPDAGLSWYEDSASFREYTVQQIFFYDSTNAALIATKTDAADSTIYMCLHHSQDLL